MACSLKSVMTCGIILAILDILHGLTTIAFYGYKFLFFHFYLCSNEMSITTCLRKHYSYEQLYEYRTYIGLGEGLLTLLFAIIYIIALVKYQPGLSWMWIFKSFAVMGVNIYYISLWKVRQDSIEEIFYQNEDDQGHLMAYLMAAAGLTVAQLALMLVFCIITAIYSYKVSQERRRSRRSLRNLHPRSPKFRNGNPSAPPMDGYDDNASYLNQALTDSTNKLPLQTSSSSIDKADTLKQQPTEV